MNMLSIIIVNYNTSQLLFQCLSAIYARNYPFLIEIILVDNGSHDNSVAMVREYFPDVCLIENNENLGFAKANNIGLAGARGNIILMLNSDTKILEDALPKLMAFLNTHPDVAVVSGRLVYPDFSDQGVARAFPTPINAFFGRTTLLNKIFPHNGFSKKYLVSRSHTSDEPFEVDWVSGACLMVKKSVLAQVGLLDEKFFMYWEDADFCFRLKQKGWKVFCVPEAKIIHYEGKSTRRKSSARLIIEFHKSVYRYYRKHYIKSVFEPMNAIAVSGLFLRTLVLLGVNIFKAKNRGGERKRSVASPIDI